MSRALTEEEFSWMNGDLVAQHHGFYDWHIFADVLPKEISMLTYKTYADWVVIYYSPLMQALREDVAIDEEL